MSWYRGAGVQEVKNVLLSLLYYGRNKIKAALKDAYTIYLLQLVVHGSFSTYPKFT